VGNFWIGLVIGVTVFLVHKWIWDHTPARHARWQMRAKLAQWLLEGRVHPAIVKKGKLVLPVRRARRQNTPKRAPVLSVVRRDDQSA
jgi:hypothetical protein